MLSPIYQDPGVDPFDPFNLTPEQTEAVLRSDIEFGPMPETDQLGPWADTLSGPAAGVAIFATGAARLWWSPYRGALYSSRSGGTVLADYRGRAGLKSTRIDRAAAIYDITRGLSGLRRWSGRGSICVAHHSLLMAAMGADASLGRSDLFGVACFMGQHDGDEAFGHGDISSPIGRLADGLLLEHRKRATAAVFNLVRPAVDITTEFMDWAGGIDHEAAALEYAWDFRRIPFWLKEGTRAHLLASAMLDKVGEGTRNPPGLALLRGAVGRDVVSQARAVAEAQRVLYELLVGAEATEAGARNQVLMVLHAWSKEDLFASAALDVWRDIGPLRRPEAP